MRHSSPRAAIAAVAALALALAGCTALMRRPDPPRVSLTNIRLLELGLFEQRFELGLRVQNPNEFGLDLAGMDYRLEVNGESFATGVAADRVSVPASGETVIYVPVSANLLENLGHLQRWQLDPPDSLDYRLTGGVRLSDFGFRVPFDYTGSVPLIPEGDQ
ncbi:MAG TPA: LEA type 2 family protein [Arenicellales bacterium]|nr:LEA type 2 family protein [Arenicellales bacterium]